MKSYGFFQAFKDLFKYSKENRKQYVLGTLFMLFFVITSMIYTTKYSNLIASIMSMKLDVAFKLVFICGIWRIISITFCHNQWRRIVIDAEKQVVSNIQKKIYKKILSLSMTTFNHIESGKLLTTMKATESGMITTITSLLLESAYVATSFVMLVIIYFIDYKIGLGVTLISAISLYLFKVQLNKSKNYLDEEFINTDEYTTLVNETVKGMKEIKTLNIKNKLTKIFSKYIYNLSGVRKRRRLLNKNVNTIKWTIRIIGDTIILLYIISKVQAGVFSVETAMLIITYMTNVVDDVFHRIIEHDFGISEFTANMKRIREILENGNLEEEKFGTENYNHITGSIEFQNIYFKYDNSKKEILENISFKVEPYTKTAIVGESGVGKSTIFKLLLKEYDNYKGIIKFDDKDIKQFNEESFRNSISIVNQEPILFNMSIKENLLIVNEKATQEDIENACRLANIDEFINKLPNQYDELIHENNNNISVGQKQRIAIARAILRDTPIILFDEATSALDNYSKREIEKTIDKLSKSKTVILIAHSLELVQDFDKIIMIKDGKIIEEGKHEDLLRKHGKYFELANIM
ncbi:MAG: ABC transporter ATP-binding protein [Clostridia bacterium]